MTSCLKPLVASVLAAASLPGWAMSEGLNDPGYEPTEPSLPAVTVSAPASPSSAEGPSAGLTLEGGALAPLRLGSSDTAALLEALPGLSLYGAGGVSSLPVIHGLADDRLRIQLDGMDLMAACPNHMNSPLSYIDASQVGRVRVFAGVTPVSVGGDSLGGTIQVESAAPEFAAEGQGVITRGHLGSFYRSNGRGRGGDVSLWVANEWLSLSYSASSAQSDNLSAAASFKGNGFGAGSAIAGDEIGSSAYRARNQSLGLALQHDNHGLQLQASWQDIPFEGYPNQRMDMTGNHSTQLNARYQGRFSWGELQAQLYGQRTSHRMDMGPDRDSYGAGMPMVTESRNTGASLKATLNGAPRDLIRLGAEAQYQVLNDRWPPVGGTMGPNAFWNLNHGQRLRRDAFAEWEARWGPAWSSLLGLRLTSVGSDAAAVQGYNNTLGSLWGQDAAAFNAQGHRRSDRSWDLTAIGRYSPAEGRLYEWGYARKSRSPSLYQRYPWSTQPMAALMNNLTGDGNGYIGNLALQPEVAHTLSASAEAQAAGMEPDWQWRGTAYLTRIEQAIEAVRCDFGQCGAANLENPQGFLLLQYRNQQARLYGLDLSGRALLLRRPVLGTLHSSAVLNWVQGNNLSARDKLAKIMPLNLRWSIEQSLGAWSQSLEWVAVSAKTRVSQTRNEIPTPGYALWNWRASYRFQKARLDLGLDNLLNRFYSPPLGGAYLGQGSSMAINGIPWGGAVPGKGRAVQVALGFDF